jgi:predicted GTPase
MRTVLGRASVAISSLVSNLLSSANELSALTLMALGTKTVTWYQARVNGQHVQLLDTPGFDDITLSDSEILEAIAKELARIYQDNRALNGLVYVYDISKTRYGRQSTKVRLQYRDTALDGLMRGRTSKCSRSSSARTH